MKNNDFRIFQIANSRARILKSEGPVKLEKELQKFVEKNLDGLLGVTYLDSQYQVGDGRIDTVGLDDKNHPVIIEYKKGRQDGLVTQVLGYRNNLTERKGDFTLLVQEKESERAGQLKWPVRAICIASEFNTHEKNAVKNGKTELIQYEYFEDNLFILKWIAGTPPKQMGQKSATKQGVKKNRRRKITLAQMEQLRKEANTFAEGLPNAKREKATNYFAYKKGTRNFASLIPATKAYVKMFLSLNPENIPLEDGFTRDMRDIKHPGTGDLQVSIHNKTTLRKAKKLIKKSYRQVGR